MPWEIDVRYGSLRADGERVVVTATNDELGMAEFFRAARIMRAGNSPLPDMTLEHAKLDEIEFDPT